MALTSSFVLAQQGDCYGGAGSLNFNGIDLATDFSTADNRVCCVVDLEVLVIF